MVIDEKSWEVFGINVDLGDRSATLRPPPGTGTGEAIRLASRLAELLREIAVGGTGGTG